MSTGFNWFKQYEIIHHEDGHWYDWYELRYLYGGSTSHSSGNITYVQDLIEKYSGKRIPQINDEWIDSENYNLDLIEPSEMLDICDRILTTHDFDGSDMRGRIEFFRKLSKHGYYLTYDSY